MPDIKTCAPRDTAPELIDQVEQGCLSVSYLQKNFKRRPLVWDTLKHTETEMRLLKAMYSILQIGVFLTHERHIAVFKRMEREKDPSTRKITSGLSVLQSWSPAQLGPSRSYHAELARKLSLPPNVAAEARWTPYGVAYNDMAELDEPMMPFYLFLLYRVELPHRVDAVIPDRSKSKSPQLSLGWMPFAAYSVQNGTLTAKGRRLEVQGAIDRLVLSSLQSRRRRFSDESRGHSFLDRRCSPEPARKSVRFRVATRPTDAGKDVYNEYIQRISSSLPQRPSWRDFLLSFTLQLGPIGCTIGTLASMVRKMRS